MICEYCGGEHPLTPAEFENLPTTYHTGFCDGHSGTVLTPRKCSIDREIQHAYNCGFGAGRDQRGGALGANERGL